MMTHKGQAVVPARPIELTLIAQYDNPWSSPGEELQAVSLHKWHPTINDFEAVANVPNHGRRTLTMVKRLGRFDEFLGAIIKVNETQVRATHSIGRLNLITHASSGLISLSGTVTREGGCDLGRFDFSNALASLGMDSSAMSWLNTTEEGKGYRDAAREKFTEDAEIWIIACNGAVGTSVGVVLDMSGTFGVKVAAYDDVISYWPVGNDTAIDRARTSIGFIKDAKGNYVPKPEHPIGRGYYCWVKVPPSLAGTHLQSAKVQKMPLLP